jgi:hypothetical protein
MHDSVLCLGFLRKEGGREGLLEALVSIQWLDLLPLPPSPTLCLYDTNRVDTEVQSGVSDMVEDEGGREGQGTRRSDGGQEEEELRCNRLCAAPRGGRKK